MAVSVTSSPLTAKSLLAQFEKLEDEIRKNPGISYKEQYTALHTSLKTNAQLKKEENYPSLETKVREVFKLLKPPQTEKPQQQKPAARRPCTWVSSNANGVGSWAVSRFMQARSWGLTKFVNTTPNYPSLKGYIPSGILLAVVTREIDQHLQNKDLTTEMAKSAHANIHKFYEAHTEALKESQADHEALIKKMDELWSKAYESSKPKEKPSVPKNVSVQKCIDCLGEAMSPEKAISRYARLCDIYAANKVKFQKDPLFKQFVQKMKEVRANSVLRCIDSLNESLKPEVSLELARACYAKINFLYSMYEGHFKRDELFTQFEQKLNEVKQKFNIHGAVQPFIGLESSGANNCWINSVLQYLNCNPLIRAWLTSDQCPDQLASVKRVLIAMEKDRGNRQITCSVPSATVREALREIARQEAIRRGISNPRISESGMEDAEEGFMMIMGFLQIGFGTSATFFDTPLVNTKYESRTYKWDTPEKCPKQGKLPGQLGIVDAVKKEGRAITKGPKGLSEIHLTLPEDIVPGDFWGGYDPNATAVEAAANGVELLRLSLSSRAHPDDEGLKLDTEKSGKQIFKLQDLELHFETPPPYLFVTASRMQSVETPIIDEATGNVRMVRTAVKKNCPILMPLTPISLPAKHFTSTPELVPPGLTEQYELCAMVKHFGTRAGGGHYMAFIKRDGKWYKMNDSVGSEIQESGHPQGDDIATHAKGAYLYQFRRVTPRSVVGPKTEAKEEKKDVKKS